MLLIHAAILAIAVFALSPKSFPPAPEYGRPSSVLELLYTILTYLGGYSLGPSLASIQTYGPWVPLWSNGIEVAAVMAVCLLIGITYLRSLCSLLSSKGAALFLLDLAMVGGYAAFSAFPYNVR